MLRDLVLIGAAVLLAAAAAAADAKVCPSMDVRNRPENFEKLRNCTVIMGDLKIVLMHTMQDGSVFDKYVFPELVEVEDYIIIFSIRHLTSIGKLFPNLRVIRGNVLFHDYALVIYKMDHLQEIGLTNLQYINRGDVRIDYCPKLCFADTINWKSIGAYKLHYFKTTEEKTCENQFCPGECRGYCWNNTHCQKFPVPGKCHPQCIGCSKEGSPRHCNTCKYYEDHGECVQVCPSSKYANNYTMKCLTEEECTTMLNGTWWIFEKTCVQSCPVAYEKIESPEKGCRPNQDYTKICSGIVIDSLSLLEEMAPCTHINGSLSIRLSKLQLNDNDLEKNLGRIVSIGGFLKISRSSVVRSLEFFKSLRVIKGKSLENRKALFVFENPNLQKLWDFDNNFSLIIEHGSVAFYDNPQLCYSEIERLMNHTLIKNKTDGEEISKYSNGDKSTCNPKNMTVSVINKTSTEVTISWNFTHDEEEDEDVLGYMVYYIEADKVWKETEDKGACNADIWNSVFVHSNVIAIEYLSAYTRYGYYIQTYRRLSYGEQTPIYYFTTATDDPSGPLALNAVVLNDTSIRLVWGPPSLMNGDLSHYIVTMYLQEDYLSLIEQRNYCKHPHKEVDEEVELQPKVSTTTVSTNCPCLVKETNRFVSDGFTCGIEGNDCDQYVYSLDEETFGDKINMQKISMHKRALVEDSTNDSIQKFRFFNVTTENSTITNLRHFTMYIFYVAACNQGDNNSSRCGGVEMAFNRTMKKEDADNIDDFKVLVNEKGIFVEWTEPLAVNSVVVSYQIEHKRIDLEHAKSTTECITRQQHLKVGEKYKIVGLSPGKYRIRVRATSLAGPGKFSSWKMFEVNPPDSGLVWVYVLVAVVIILVIVLGGFFVRYWYKRKYLDNNHLITSINPDYAGPIYEEDEWELDRNDVEIIKELGQGSFGMVYEGLIKSKGYPCAVKTVNESATMISRLEFLNEGAVMKAFNDAHHVIKLLGIVSRGQPPLVIMELMERGDLKSYLRRCREPSQNLTTNEMYRMAAEIADGMAYLAAKKFVHRDLAARNCMVAADRTVKIGDFGMARDIYETDYYRKETVGLLPVRWMAPESLADGVFTSDSDVWSYGIVLWEMATLAEQPYQGLSNEQVFHFVKNKGKLDRPPECSDLLYEVMDACWMWRPNDRPTFGDIVDKLVDHVGQDFRLVSFCFSRQGRDLALNAGPRVYNPPAMVALPEDDIFGRYDASEEEVSLYLR